MADEEALPTLDEATAALQPYFEDNPYSKIEQGDVSSPVLQIIEPWGDSSLTLEIKNEFDSLASALNKMILPKRFSAVWHKDSKRLEVVWTAFNLPKSQDDIKTRKFDFVHKDKSHACEFGTSSDRLLEVARRVRPRTISDTNHRNLQSFSVYERNKGKEKPSSTLDCPRSFWISDVDWCEPDVVDLLRI